MHRNKKLFCFATAVLILAFFYQSRINSNKSPNETIFELVVLDLVSRPSEQREFAGEKILVIDEFGKGDSFFFDTGDEIENYFPQFADALENASKSNSRFPNAHAFGNSAILTSKRPLRAEDGNVSARFEDMWMVKFWRPGFSKDQKKAIVRVWRGPLMNDEVVTYVLNKNKGVWEITFLVVDIYP